MILSMQEYQQKIGELISRIRSQKGLTQKDLAIKLGTCLLYTSDAADERSSVDLGGRRIIKKKKTKEKQKKQNTDQQGYGHTGGAL